VGRVLGAYCWRRLAVPCAAGNGGPRRHGGRPWPSYRCVGNKPAPVVCTGLMNRQTVCVCVCVCVCARVWSVLARGCLRVCARLRACACLWVCGGVDVRLCARARERERERTRACASAGEGVGVLEASTKEVVACPMSAPCLVCNLAQTTRAWLCRVHTYASDSEFYIFLRNPI